jgi:hypothetical protein
MEMDRRFDVSLDSQSLVANPTLEKWMARSKSRSVANVKLIVEAVILLSAGNQSDGGKTLFAVPYLRNRLRADLKVKHQFATKEKARKRSIRNPLPQRSAANRAEG